jgi:hypothetical protein
MEVEGYVVHLIGSGDPHPYKHFSSILEANAFAIEQVRKRQTLMRHKFS